MKKIILYPAVAAIVAGGLGFWGGMALGASKGPTQASADQRFSAFGNGAQGDMRARFGGNGVAEGTRSGSRGPAFGGMTVGEVIGKDAQSITVKMPDDTSRIVFYSDATTVQKTSDVSIDEIAEGVTVRVIGSANDDGSVTAQDIQLMPEGGETFFFGAMRGQQAPPAQ